MAVKYKHLLSPIKVGNLVLKDRLISSNSLPHFLMGPETYPADTVIDHVATMARNGAAVVTFADFCKMEQRESPNEDGKRFPMFTLDSDPSVENYICQLADQVHFYNSYISLALMPFTAPDPMYDVSDEPEMTKEDLDNLLLAEFGRRKYDNYGANAMWRNGAAGKEMPVEMIHEVIEQQAQRAKKYQALGFDMVTLHFAYRATLFARFLSPKMNHRTDEYGGSLENRARFLIELCTRIKQLCGKNFPIEIQITPDEHEEGGWTIDDTIRLARMCEGVVDIFQFRASTANLNHPTGYNSNGVDYITLAECAQVKAAGVPVLCEPIGGYQYADDLEEIIASGKADLIGGARLFICDYDQYDKIKEGRGDDVVPCILCNKCHVPSLSGEWLSFCSVNPKLGINHKARRMTKPVSVQRRVAIVGGGPAGMRAALFSLERGYDVTLYEATDRLGGQLKLMDHPTFKWPLVRYRNWLISQLEKSDAKIILNTRATKEILETEGYDAVILALGATPKIPPVTGAENAYNIFTVFGNESKMGKRCVVIGGSESGTEAGLYLAENGHDVMILTRGSTLAPEATPIHYRETIDEYFQSLGNIDYITGASATEVGDGYVKYRTKDGTEHMIECDDVVALGGMGSLSDEAMSMFGVTGETVMIGDCRKVGNLHWCNRSAYAAVYNL